MNLILELFFTFLKIGLFSIGGGYATLPLIQQQAVVVHPWLTLQEFTDIITPVSYTHLALSCGPSAPSARC